MSLQLEELFRYTDELFESSGLLGLKHNEGKKTASDLATGLSLRAHAASRKANSHKGDMYDKAMLHYKAAYGEEPPEIDEHGRQVYTGGHHAAELAKQIEADRHYRAGNNRLAGKRQAEADRHRVLRDRHAKKADDLFHQVHMDDLEAEGGHKDFEHDKNFAGSVVVRKKKTTT